MRIYLVRHGRSEANDKPELYRQKADRAIELTPLGKKQSASSGQQFAHYLANHAPDTKLRVFSSPFTRTVDTRDLFLPQPDPAGRSIASRATETAVDTDLREREQGDFLGLSRNDFAEVRRTQQIPHGPNGHRPIEADDERYMQAMETGKVYDTRPKQGESGRDLCNRIRRFTANHQLLEKGEDAVVFAHANAIDAFIATLTSPNEEYCRKKFNEIMSDPKNALGNAEIVMLEGDMQRGFTATKLDIDPSREVVPLCSLIQGGAAAEKIATWRGHTI